VSLDVLPHFPHLQLLARRWPHAASLAAVILFACSLTAQAAAGAEPDKAEQEAFFESKVRPLLAEHCVACHGADEQAGELRLDRRAAVQRGGGSGPVIVPGKPEASSLIRAIGYSDNALQMPPEGKLPAEAIAVLTAWVSTGAYWPEEADQDDAPQSPAEQIDEFRNSHWAFQPIVAAEPPQVAQTQWPQQPLDQFILARLEAAGLTPNPPADRRALIHRAYFALIGLPPSYEEVEAFVADPSPDAFAQVVDRLLENRHYGERWARHWLDIARYADTTGYMGGSRETRYPYAYTYRDYVIAAFNDDKPFDRFILEQLAADQLKLEGDEQSALAAMGFLTVGRRFMNRQHDIIDDRIDVVTRGFLGMSVACARCHDHKFDPIPTADYYSLHGVFASSEEPAELPLLGQPQPSPQYEAFLQEQAKKQQEADRWLDETRVKTEDELRSRVADYLVYLARTLPQYKAGEMKQQGERGPLRPQAVRRWQQYLSQPTAPANPLWQLWQRLAALSPEEFPQRASELLNNADDPLLQSLHPRLLAALRSEPPQTMADVAQRIGSELETVDDLWRKGREADVALSRLPEEDDEALRQVLFAADSPTTLDTAQMIAHLDQGERNKHNTMLGQVKAVEVSHPGAPPRGMVLLDKPKPQEPVIFRRGQPGNRGDRVPRRFLQVLAHVDGGQPFSQGSGRLELAQAIASPDNPLTARVIVNRIWQHQFGAGLVRTSSDFGIRGETPSHPELLDHLAAEFIADGWSIKRLQRRIMLSATWQQASTVRPEAHQVDPENRLLWHMPRRRMEFEPLRDRLLAAAKQLDYQIGGRSVMIHQDAPRRGLYAYIDREDVPGLLASFDLPSPDASQAMRAQTTVPQQALYLMNAPFVIDRARALAEQTAAEESAAARVSTLYRRTLARDPDADELKLALMFLTPAPAASAADEEAPPLPPWRFGYGHFDSSSGAVQFTPLPYFNGQAWQGSSTFPDPQLSYLRLTADGGHPGSDDQHSVIRRWVSPLAGVVEIQGRLKHPQKQGDGIRGQIVSSRHGVQGEWTAHGNEVETAVTRVEVQPGDTLDFVVACGKTPSFDGFQWAPVVRLVESETADWESGFRWESASSFVTASRSLIPPEPLDPWVQLAQVLLLCNEFAFVD